MAETKTTTKAATTADAVTVAPGDRILYGGIPGVVSAVEGNDVYLFLFDKDGAGLVRGAKPGSFTKV